MIVNVVPYQSEWTDQFRLETKIIAEMLGNNYTASFHIGSTAVPGLKAKPIIDILLVVDSLEMLDKQAQLFESLGYEVMGAFGIPERRYYRKGGDHRTHQIHAFHLSNLNEIGRHLIFRDYLRSHTDVCVEYGNLKEQLALQHSKDIEAYNDGKDELVREIERNALKWHWQERK